MVDQIFDVAYWRRRLNGAKELHRAVYETNLSRWETIAAQHRFVLAQLISDGESVVDCGCGYGRLLSLLPPSWWADYEGVDISPDFIALARRLHPTYKFSVGDLRGWQPRGTYDVAVFIGMSRMIAGNAGGAIWDSVLVKVRTYAGRLLNLEYGDGGVYEWL